MKSLLVMQRWRETESLAPSSGRPHLDLLLNCLGFSEMGILELEPGAAFDPGVVDEEVGLILVQGQSHCCNMDSSRLRRSLLSNLSLSLGLDGEGSDRLRVVGAKPLYDGGGDPAGFAIKRQGRIIAYFENAIWELHKALAETVYALLSEEQNFRRVRFYNCWLVERGGSSFEISDYIEEEEVLQCQVKYLPDGDVALLIPAFMGQVFGDRLKERLADRLYAVTPEPLEEGLGDLLRSSRSTVTTAESCTAGLLSARLASVAGSSDYLLSGFVTYARQAKIDGLGVSEKLIDQHGEVSREVALAMAQEALSASGATLSVSVTGIAGPGGGSVQKPVGTVYLAAVSQCGITLEHKGFYRGDRDRIRYQASQTALHLLRRLLLKKSP
ncbi:MAG: nicotinamide-nucleotide amidohydrolase family protein [Magnetococcales bacterium]|nr:nicotinamide-nucleotide amidohydrolase family protein [Magnetococcales bacterium]